MLLEIFLHNVFRYVKHEYNYLNLHTLISRESRMGICFFIYAVV